GDGPAASDARVSNLQTEPRPDARDGGGHGWRRATRSLSWRHSNSIQRITSYLAVSQTFTRVPVAETVAFPTGWESGTRTTVCGAGSSTAPGLGPHLIGIRRARTTPPALPPNLIGIRRWRAMLGT